MRKPPAYCSTQMLQTLRSIAAGEKVEGVTVQTIDALRSRGWIEYSNAVRLTQAGADYLAGRK